MHWGFSGRVQWSRRCLVAVACGGLGACGRPAFASLLPLLELGLSAQRVRTTGSSETGSETQRWGAVGFISLRFEPRTAAAQIPLRAELSPETWVLPCDADDVICLQEALETEAELARALGDLQ